MYDDHTYCGTCGRHAVGCWCFTTAPPQVREEELAEAGDRVCLLATSTNDWEHPTA